MSDDLVKRLREGRIHSLYGLRMGQAADRITTLTASLAQMTWDRDMLANGGVIEVAIRNPSVSDYMKHWEGRAEAAEADNAKLREEIAAAKLFGGGYFAAIVTEATRDYYRALTAGATK